MANMVRRAGPRRLAFRRFGRRRGRHDHWTRHADVNGDRLGTLRQLQPTAALGAERRRFDDALRLFYLMFAPAGAVWSLDALRRRGGRRPDPAVVGAAMQIQLCVMYFFTGVSKLGDGLIGNDWITGEAVYWVLNDLSLTRWPYYYLPVPLIVCRFLSWGTLAFELGFAFVMAMPPRTYTSLSAIFSVACWRRAARRHSGSHGSRLV